MLSVKVTWLPLASCQLVKTSLSSPPSAHGQVCVQLFYLYLQLQQLEAYLHISSLGFIEGECKLTRVLE